eukprot:COSAG04_NODE_15790_length_520_cov_0.859857_1_plen_46_part_10
MRERIEAALAGTDAALAEDTMDDALELDDPEDELEEMLIKLEMHAE